ncbi:MAG TPA: hypothetical protein VGE21_04120 [Flavobacteriales bacterium]
MVNGRSFTFALLLLSGQVVNAQSATGIRGHLDLFNNDGLKDGPRTSTVAGFGVDHDLNPRLSIGLDVAFGLGSKESINLGGSSSGLLEVNTLSFIYRSAYCFSSNEDRTAGYFGPFVGYTRASSDLRIYDQGFSPTTITSARTLIPVGLRVGVRGGLRGFYGDVYCSAGYRFNAGSPLFDGTGLPAVDNATLRNLVFSFGIALGGGWEY